MNTPIADDYASIAIELKRIETEKASALSAPLTEAAPDGNYAPYHGWALPDHDPA